MTHKGWNTKAKYLLVLVLSCLLYGESLLAQDNSGIRRKILIIGDTQHIGAMESLYWDYWSEHNQAKTQSLFKEMARREPEFIIHLGDLTRDGSKKSAWKEFDADSRPVTKKKIPFYPVFGNHEYFGHDENMYNYFNARFPAVKYRKWYSTSSGGLGVILINTNFGELSEEELRLQKLWYAGELNELEKDTSINWIIVAGHHPPFTNSRIVSPSSAVETDFAVPFIKSKKGLFFFSGHCHSYERFTKDGKYFVVSGGGGGPRQKLQNDKAKRKFDDKFEGPEVRFFHFCEITLSRNSLYFSMIRLNDDGTFSPADQFNVSR